MRAPPARSRPSWRLVGWMIPAAMGIGVGVAVRVVLSGPGGLFPWIVGVLVLFPILWVAASALSPAAPDRRCPACGRDAVGRMRPEGTIGLECGSCGWHDETASAWLLAEEEGPLEELVLDRRARKKRAARKPLPSAVDSSRARD